MPTYLEAKAVSTPFCMAMEAQRVTTLVVPMAKEVSVEEQAKVIMQVEQQVAMVMPTTRWRERSDVGSGVSPTDNA